MSFICPTTAAEELYAVFCPQGGHRAGPSDRVVGVELGPPIELIGGEERRVSLKTDETSRVNKRSVTVTTEGTSEVSRVYTVTHVEDGRIATGIVDLPDRFLQE